jgi:hypothetical protein
MDNYYNSPVVLIVLQNCDIYARGTVLKTEEWYLHKVCLRKHKLNDCLVMATSAWLCANLQKCSPSAVMTAIQFTCCPPPTHRYHGHMMYANVAATNFKYHPRLLLQCTMKVYNVLINMNNCDHDSLWRLGVIRVFNLTKILSTITR